ncbi:hypothetical protein [Saccharothrix carnea]|uniref:hypothetical protein n=1 Tax=Saccharothrix carnea TaxID=1280637 RepID=UPI000D0D4EC1|nr:hypothetical protein [Saccharothrix carnea]
MQDRTAPDHHWARQVDDRTMQLTQRARALTRASAQSASALGHRTQPTHAATARSHRTRPPQPAAGQHRTTGAIITRTTLAVPAGLGAARVHEAATAVRVHVRDGPHRIEAIEAAAAESAGAWWDDVAHGGRRRLDFG